MDVVGDIKAEDLDVMFFTNVFGLINMTQAILPTFRKRPDGGHGDIVNIGSIAGRDHYQRGSVYCATKAAVSSFTNAMRKELINTKIRVMEVAPGQVETVSMDIVPPNWMMCSPGSLGILGRPLLWGQSKSGRSL